MKPPLKSQKTTRKTVSQGFVKNVETTGPKKSPHSKAIRSVRAIYPGTFDPFTNGHLDILDRSIPLFSEVQILVSQSHSKTALFSLEERIELIRKIIKNRPTVSVVSWSGLTMEYAKNEGFQAVVRGLRAASDFEYEFMMASMNKAIDPEVETLFMMTSQDKYFISSSMIKELFRFGGDISAYVPKEILQALKKKKI